MIGGMENFVYLLSVYQLKQGDDVTVLTLNRNFMTNEKLEPEGEYQQIKIKRIPYLGINKYPLAFSALRHLNGFDIIHVHGVDFFIDYLAFTKVFHRKKLILHTHGGFFHTRWGYMFKKVFFNTVTRFTVNRCNKVIAISNNDFRPFSRLTGKIVQVENGIHFENYQKSKHIETGTLLTVGRIDIHKRIDQLIKITLILNEKDINSKLRIVGPDWKGMKDDLLKIIPEKHKESIIFVGPVDDEKLTQEYAKAHLFLSASEYEGFGLTAIEAMASGTMVVLNDIDSFRVFLENKEFGSIANFSDLEKTADQIAKYLALPESEYQKRSDQARKYAESYSWAKIESRIRDVYNEVLN